MDKWQRRSPQTRSPHCGCSHGSAGDFDTRRKKKNDRVQAQGERRRTIGFKRGMSGLLFYDIFKVENADPEGKKYDKRPSAGMNFMVSWLSSFSDCGTE
ncbi:hypothetical protein JHK82_052847 [Glycine max]|nr:hypothetical protein JHK86_052701 [Glycine max]KAG4927068.1 hypothetical protein JHK85_053554 [Glycine max]KAG5082692.1 hypothetical protein JHK84_052730 [Glycine max]KAG5085450.1 hypothetical protein JHK82_052847 [Glycine max]